MPTLPLAVSSRKKAILGSCAAVGVTILLLKSWQAQKSRARVRRKEDQGSRAGKPKRRHNDVRGVLRLLLPSVTNGAGQFPVLGLFLLSIIRTVLQARSTYV